MKSRYGLKFLSVALATAIAASAGARSAFAQDDAGGDDGDVTFSPDETEGTPPADTPPADDPGPVIDDGPVIDEPAAPTGAPAKKSLGSTRESWKDIIVIPQKKFLKRKRFELSPHLGITINDNMIRHFTQGAEINYFLTDALSIGVEGNFFIAQELERYNLTPQQHWRVPTANKYIWNAALNFSYIPFYGKFALFNRATVHWESWVAAGVGVGQSEVLPRDPANEAFKNFLIQPNVGGGLRFFIFDWLALHMGVRDYIFLDKFEATNRPPGGQQSGDTAKEKADSALINNVVAYAGLSFWFPLSFKYSTLR